MSRGSEFTRAKYSYFWLRVFRATLSREEYSSYLRWLEPRLWFAKLHSGEACVSVEQWNGERFYEQD